MQNKKRKITVILLIACAAFIVLYFTVLRTSLLKIRYKLAHEEKILLYSEEFGLDPSLTAAVIFTESDFDPNAKSRVGATGLMQLMPNTAKEVAEMIGVESYSENMLTDPDINIRFGCYYLSQMLSEFGSVKNTLSAYNAGPGRTRSWIKEYGVNDSNELLYIPYPETEKYVGKVASAQKIYKVLYPELTPQTGKE